MTLPDSGRLVRFTTPCDHCRRFIYFILSLAVVMILALTGCGSTTRYADTTVTETVSAPAIAITQTVTAQPSPSPLPTSSVALSCQLGFYDEEDPGMLLPLNIAYWDDGYDLAEKVTFTNNGSSGIIINAFSVSTSYEGQVYSVNPVTISPWYLPSGQWFSDVVNNSASAQDSGNIIHISSVTYLGSSCTISSWS